MTKSNGKMPHSKSPTIFFWLNVPATLSIIAGEKAGLPDLTFVIVIVIVNTTSYIAPLVASHF